MKYRGQEIVYIEYQNGKPFAACTAQLGQWSLENFDFETDCADVDSFMHHNSGGGGLATEIPAPHYIDGCKDTCSYWLHPEASLRGKAKNIKKIESPISINGNKNPFASSREVLDIIYCKHCDKYLDEDWCDHLDVNDDGVIVYTDGSIH
jgi:hypothetical protein